MIHVVLGTKAQLIKMAPLMIRMEERGVPYRFVHTGQHQATIDEMLAEFGLRAPDLRLYDGPDIVSPGQMAGWIAKILVRCVTARGQIFGSSRSARSRHDLVLVHGDTFSTLLGALMGRVGGLRVGHVESGLRSFDWRDPFPEELTRRLAFRLCHELYCPGPWAMGNVAHLARTLLDSGVNTLADTLAFALAQPRPIAQSRSAPYALVSLHRYENIFSRHRFPALLEHLERVSRKMRLLFILHPPTASQLERFGLRARLERNSQIELRPRYTYLEFVSLLEHAEFVLTDGGSIQEESAYLGLPCLLLRKSTERREGLGENVVLSEFDAARIDAFVDDYPSYRREAQTLPFAASDRIIDWIASA